MRTLLLMRHGAAASPPGYADRERPLTNRGRGRSLRAGDDLRRRQPLPERVLLSPAVRARETWEAYALGLQAPQNIESVVETDGRIYQNTVDDLLDALRETIDDVTNVLVIGHNPSIAGLAGVLDESTQNPLRSELTDGFPTASVAVFEFDTVWSELREGEARLTEALVRR